MRSCADRPAKRNAINDIMMAGIERVFCAVDESVGELLDYLAAL